MDTPVVVILFNRPDKVARVMREVARARPTRLFLVADGPRAEHPEDVESCRLARAAADQAITWECEVHRNYSEVNLGCGHRPSSGISWAFEHVEEAIILEDDCVPHPTFFPFCEELLHRYRDDERVMHINGSTYRRDATKNNSYSFTNFVGCWGWATWRRAWSHFDLSVRLWPHLRRSGFLEQILDGNEEAIRFFHQQLQRAYEHTGNLSALSYWDYQWLFACWGNSGLGIVPGRNLISNVGAGDRATHTADHPLANLPSDALPFPLRHPPLVLADWRRDQRFFQQILLPLIATRPRSRWARIGGALARLAPRLRLTPPSAETRKRRAARTLDDAA